MRIKLFLACAIIMHLQPLFSMEMATVTKAATFQDIFSCAKSIATLNTQLFNILKVKNISQLCQGTQHIVTDLLLTQKILQNFGTQFITKSITFEEPLLTSVKAFYLHIIKDDSIDPLPQDLLNLKKILIQESSFKKLIDSTTRENYLKSVTHPHSPILKDILIMKTIPVFRDTPLAAAFAALLLKDILIKLQQPLQNSIKGILEKIEECTSLLKTAEQFKENLDAAETNFLKQFKEIIPQIKFLYETLQTHFTAEPQIITPPQLARAESDFKNLALLISNLESHYFIKGEKKVRPKPKRRKKPVGALQIAPKEEELPIAELEELKIEKEEEPTPEFDLVKFFNTLFPGFFPKEYFGRVIGISENKVTIWDNKNKISIILNPEQPIEVSPNLLQGLLRRATNVAHLPQFQLGPRARLWFQEPLQALEQHGEGKFDDLATLPKAQKNSLIEHAFPRMVDVFAWLYGSSEEYIDIEGQPRENKKIKGSIIYPDGMKRFGEFNFAWSGAKTGPYKGLYHRWFERKH